MGRNWLFDVVFYGRTAGFVLTIAKDFTFGLADLPPSSHRPERRSAVAIHDTLHASALRVAPAVIPESSWDVRSAAGTLPASVRRWLRQERGDLRTV